MENSSSVKIDSRRGVCYMNFGVVRMAARDLATPEVSG